MVVSSRNDLLMCLTFPSSLEGVVLDWFYFLPPHSFCNFEVSGAFLTQYVSRWEAKRNNHHLFTVKIRRVTALNPMSGPRSPTGVMTSPHSHSSAAASLSPHVQTSLEAQCHFDQRGSIPSSALHLVGGGNKDLSQLLC